VVRVEETSNNFFEFRSSDAPATDAAQG